MSKDMNIDAYYNYNQYLNKIKSINHADSKQNTYHSADSNYVPLLNMKSLKINDLEVNDTIQNAQKTTEKKNRKADERI